jgi:WD40 repeat protein
MTPVDLLVAGSANPDNSLYLWDLNSMAFVRDFPQAHKGLITSVSCLHDGHAAISASLDGFLVAWDLSAGIPSFLSFSNKKE